MMQPNFGVPYPLRVHRDTTAAPLPCEILINRPTRLAFAVLDGEGELPRPRPAGIEYLWLTCGRILVVQSSPIR